MRTAVASVSFSCCLLTPCLELFCFALFLRPVSNWIIHLTHMQSVRALLCAGWLAGLKPKRFQLTREWFHEIACYVTNSLKPFLLFGGTAMHIIREKTDCNQKMKCGYLVPPKVWRTFFFYCSPRLIPIRESMVQFDHKFEISFWC